MKCKRRKLSVRSDSVSCKIDVDKRLKSFDKQDKSFDKPQKSLDKSQKSFDKPFIPAKKATLT